MEGVSNVLKVSELNNRVKERAYQERWRDRDFGEGMGKVQRYSNGAYQ